MVAAIVAAASLFAATACSRTAISQTVIDTDNTSTQIVLHDEVLLLPPVGENLDGWCLTVSPVGCPAAQAFRGPIIAEVRNGQGPPPVQVVTILTTSKVTAVSINGGRAIPTRPEAVLPDDLRAVVVEIRGGPRRYIPGFGVHGPAPPHITPLGPNKKPISSRVEPNGPFVFTLPGAGWKRPKSAPPGVCETHAKDLGGLEAVNGVVVSQIKSYAGLTVARGGNGVSRARRYSGLISQGFISCASTSYRLNGWSLLAGVLLDASHPGSRPTPLPAMKPLSGHQGVFQALGSEGEMVARRISGAWLVVAKGKGVQQRLTLLEHLRARVHL